MIIIINFIYVSGYLAYTQRASCRGVLFLVLRIKDRCLFSMNNLNNRLKRSNRMKIGKYTQIKKKIMERNGH